MAPHPCFLYFSPDAHLCARGVLKLVKKRSLYVTGCKDMQLFLKFQISLLKSNKIGAFTIKNQLKPLKKR